MAKVKIHTLDIVPLRSESPPQKRYGIKGIKRRWSQLRFDFDRLRFDGRSTAYQRSSRSQ